MYYSQSYQQSFFLPSSLSNGQEFYIQCNGNTNSSPTAITILPVNINNEVIFTYLGTTLTSINGTRNYTYRFIFYTSDNPWNNNSQAYPKWTMDTIANNLPVPEYIQLVVTRTMTIPAPSTPFMIRLSVLLRNKQSIQFLDIGGNASVSGTPVNIERGDTSFVFSPSATYLQYLLAGFNAKMINISGVVYPY